LGVALVFNSYVLADDTTDKSEKKDSGHAVKDLPKPLPQVMDKIKEVGNEASKGINRASQGFRDLADKATKKTKEADQPKVPPK
jgi:uncharacterized protein YoxC